MCYSVLVIYPVMEMGYGLEMYHSRVGKCSGELKLYITGVLPKGNCLFVKVRVGLIDKWKRVCEGKSKIVGIVDEKRGLEIV
jgi:hypothetical protein